MKKTWTQEQIISLLREAESGQATIAGLCRLRGVSQNSFYKWRTQYGAMTINEAKRLKAWLATQSVQTLYIEPGSPWQNGKSESMHGKLRDECLERELFDTKLEARCLIENYRKQFNSHRPHSALNYQTPDEFARNWHQKQTSLT